MTRGRATLLVAMVAGALIRAAALPLPGAGDVDPWKVWSYHAVKDGVTRLYGSGSPPQAIDFVFHDSVAAVNYPPLALYELAAAGWVYSLATGGRFPDTVALTMTMKLLPVLFEAGIVATLFMAIRRTVAGDRAQWAAVAYWLNPAAIACASIGGYIDALPALPALGALVAAVVGFPAVAGGLVACAVLTKPQGVLVLPAVLLAVWNNGDPRRTLGVKRLTTAAAGGLVISAIILAPIVIAGVWPNMVHMLKTMTDDESLSMSGYNVWWLAGHAMTVAYAWTRGADVWAAVTAPATYVAFDRVAAHGLGHLRAAGTLLAVAGIGWGIVDRTTGGRSVAGGGGRGVFGVRVRAAGDARAREPRVHRHSAPRGCRCRAKAIRSGAGRRECLVHAEPGLLWRRERRRPLRHPAHVHGGRHDAAGGRVRLHLGLLVRVGAPRGVSIEQRRRMTRRVHR